MEEENEDQNMEVESIMSMYEYFKLLEAYNKSKIFGISFNLNGKDVEYESNLSEEKVNVTFEIPHNYPSVPLQVKLESLSEKLDKNELYRKLEEELELKKGFPLLYDLLICISQHLSELLETKLLPETVETVFSLQNLEKTIPKNSLLKIPENSYKYFSIPELGKWRLRIYFTPNYFPRHSFLLVPLRTSLLVLGGNIDNQKKYDWIVDVENEELFNIHSNMSFFDKRLGMIGSSFCVVDDVVFISMGYNRAGLKHELVSVELMEKSDDFFYDIVPREIKHTDYTPEDRFYHTCSYFNHKSLSVM